MHRRIALVFAILLVGAPAEARWTNYRQIDGLAADAVTAIAEDPGGGTWLGTTNGLSHFDGVRWKTVRDSLGFSGVTSLLRDERGHLWVGSNGSGLRIQVDGLWTTADSASGALPSNRVTALLGAPGGDVWVACGNRLARRDGTSLLWGSVDYPSPDGLPPPSCQSLGLDSLGGLWIGTVRGAARRDPASSAWEWFQATAGGPPADSTYAVHTTADGAVWIGSGSGLFRFVAGAWRRWAFADGLPHRAITAVSDDGRGGLWVGADSSAGLARFDGTRWWSTPSAPGGSDFARVTALRLNRSLDLWVGTNATAATQPTVAAQGAFRFDGEQWTNLRAAGAASPANAQTRIERVLPSDDVKAVLETARGDVWIATADRGLARADSAGGWTSFDPFTSPAVPASLATLLEDPLERIAIGSNGAGVTRLDPVTMVVENFARAEGLASDSVTVLFVDAAGTLWVGGPSGLSGIVGSTASPMLSGQRVVEIAEDETGTLWVRAAGCAVSPPGPCNPLTPGLLYSIPPDRSRVDPVVLPGDASPGPARSLLRRADGWVWWSAGSRVGRARGSTIDAVDIPALPASYLDWLREDSRGHLWLLDDFVTGAARWDGRRLDTFPPQPNSANPANLGGGLAEDGAGTLWFSARAGESYRFNGSAFLKATTADGLTFGTQRSVVAGRVGRAWWSTQQGATIYEPRQSAPHAVLLAVPDSVLLRRDFEIVAAAAFGETDAVDFRLRLDGVDVSGWGRTTRFPIAAIADGSHRIELHARDWTGRESRVPAVATFSVDATAPAPVVQFPAFNDTLRGVVGVIGQAIDPRFRGWRLESKPVAAAWNGASTDTLAASAVPVAGGLLASWDTTALPDGFYDLRLLLEDVFGIQGSFELRLQVDNVAPFAGETSPLRIVADQGGSVSTLLGEMLAVFPPNGFDADPELTFDAEPPGTPGSGALHEPVAIARLAWSGANLRKPFLLQAVLPEPADPQVRHALYREGSAGEWTRLGGSLDPEGNALVVTTQGEGRYALAAESGAAPGAIVETGLRITPRTLSRSAPGRVDLRRVAIGFALGAASRPHVRIHNRAGRLVRDLSPSGILAAGENVVFWDGHDEDGRNVRDGLYVVTVETAESTRSQALTVLP